MYSNTYMTNKIRNQLRNLDKFTAKKFGLKEWDVDFFIIDKWHSNSNQFQNSRMIIY